jgi:wyosine [tRNA(Phe)-imidazoG37] synthetase (radical SAM superfamily)
LCGYMETARAKTENSKISVMNSYKYIFGPVPSRRLGLSLGVDIIPLKTCTQNCIYCQLCTDAPQLTQRKEYCPIDDVLDELKRKLAEHPTIDCVTISGSGEPTLNSGLGRLLRAIKEITDTMTVVITNSTLLWREDVREELMAADVVMPSLDACDQQTFERINKPAEGISFEKLIDGLKKFRGQFKGRLLLEVFMVDQVNTSDQQIMKFRELIEQIDPDKIQLNTAVRPTTAMDVGIISEDRLKEIASKLSDKAEVIAKFTRKTSPGSQESFIEKVMETLKRRPCSVEGLSASLGVSRERIEEQIYLLLKKNIIRPEERSGETYYIMRDKV